MYLKLAWRNLWRNRRRTLITVSSIMFAVVAALLMESIGAGTRSQLLDNMTSFQTGYIQIQDYRYEDEPSPDNAFLYNEELEQKILSSDDDIDFLIPRIETFMLSAGEEITRGAIVMGVNIDKEDRFNQLRERLEIGEFGKAGSNQAVIGRGLGDRLNIAVGDTLVLLGQGRFGMTASGLFEVSGLIQYPLRELDNQIVYLPLEDMQWMLSAEDHITNLVVAPEHTGQVDKLAQSLSQTVSGDDLKVLTWKEMMPELIEALKFDELSGRLMLWILYVVIGFGIFGTVLTMTLERKREFGILLSVGMYRTKLALVVFIETFFISILGVLSGFVFGSIVLLYFYFNPIEFTGDMAELMIDFGFEPIMVFSLSPKVFLLQGAAIFIITTFICLYPTLKIARMNILESKK
ncbi:ABC transporter permease [Rhodohalobacter barkolensis]|uniref:Outer membrane-specific lipoprotein transporter subunit LolC n=1 Tax=Rhodohalobacter barkolensis TaxID=2053187 RepID=A0A2N0VHX2_9BACT|nr:FtsX-like permease family protein [Rhodohalobacter barkolensis]PKD43787.1 outer membrane-specific lipoprotein transporter subunit LolC [Rhodohalobacter barkolensis]